MADRSGFPTLFLLLGLLAGGIFLAQRSKQELLEPYQSYAKGVFVEIVPGTGRIAIAGQLRDAGVLRHRWPFLLLSFSHHKRTLKAGEYFFDRPMTPREVFEKVSRGEVFHYTITVPEGYSMYDIAELLGRQGIFRPEIFLAAAANPALVRDFASEARSLEGFLFPDTYQLTRRQTPADLQAAMVKRFRDVHAGLGGEKGNPPGLSTYQLVTLASLVEKESSDPDERGVIAGVFYNRLHRNRPLECDPTVIYAARLARPGGQARRGGQAGRFNGTISQADLKRPSPYNTYVHVGLPPGPIANPGRSSLEAVLFPRSVDYLYFVANTRGGHFFSRTLAEHNRNVSRYRHLLNTQAAQRAPGARP